jgi:hypothetical protein
LSDQALDGASELVVADLRWQRPATLDERLSRIMPATPAADRGRCHADEGSGTDGVETEAAQLEDSVELRHP